MTFSPTGFSLQIFKDRYAFTDQESWIEACERVANQMAIAEKSDRVEKYRKKFYEVLVNNYFVPGGRIWYNSGRPNPQLLNCFVLTNKLDSKEGWARLSYENIVTSMTGGGCGQDFSDIRPAGADINGHRGKCPGPVVLMKGINAGAHMVRAGGGRRSANMFSLDLDHPEVLNFIEAKVTKGELDMANVSVRSKHTLDFINAVKEDGEWELSWKGKYKTFIRARDLWNKIVQNAWTNAEPGFLNMELALAESTIYYIEELITTNPCGEIFLTAYGNCCLGHLVLPRFVVNGTVDWDLIANVVSDGVRFLDNVLDVNTYPMPEMKEASQRLRRIGLGCTGLADMLMTLGLRYGSEEGNRFIEKLYRFISKAAYDASILLAAEKGAFPACKPDLHVKSGFVSRMPPRVKNLIKQHGIRNCALLTQAPTGTVSILSGNCSSGIEPTFAPAYWRTYWDQEVRKKELCFHPLFVEFVKTGKALDHFVASHELSVRDHMEVQAIIQKHMDNAVSKTINMPENYPVEEMSKLWLEYLPRLKGTTFYRDNSRKFYRADGTEEAPPLTPITIEEALKLLSEQEPTTTEAATTSDCPSGICAI